MDGRCVRLKQGDFEDSVSYGDDPSEIAVGFEKQSVSRLHVVDLDGARTGNPANLDVLRSIKSRTDLVVDYGGGLRTREAVGDALAAGADMVSVGSIAVRSPSILGDWISTFGADRFILAADVKDGFVTVSGWTETTAVEVETAIARAVDVGIRSVLVTDVSVDGTLEGPSVSLYDKLRRAFPKLYLIAAGGVGSGDDLRALEETGVDAAIVGKALYEGRIELSEFV